jgi:hypothetical protein
VTAVEQAGQRRRWAASVKKTTRDLRRPWKVGKARSKTKQHMVRWVIAGEVFTETFASFKPADGFRSGLIQAINGGEEFDVAASLPVAMLESREQERAADLGWLQFCQEYVAARWNEIAPKDARFA